MDGKSSFRVPFHAVAARLRASAKVWPFAGTCLVTNTVLFVWVRPYCLSRSQTAAEVLNTQTYSNILYRGANGPFYGSVCQCHCVFVCDNSEQLVRNSNEKSCTCSYQITVPLTTHQNTTSDFLFFFDG